MGTAARATAGRDRPIIRGELAVRRLPSLHMPPCRPFPRALPVAVLACVAAGAFAQKPKAKVVLYKERLAAQFDTVDCVKNAFKINPLLFFRGEIPLYYERALTPKLSLEAGLGVTLRNYLALSFVGDDADDFGAGTDIIPNLSYHMGVRWYFEDDLEPVGTYMQVEYAHLMYSKDIHAKDPDGSITDETRRDERTYNDLRLLFGYQALGVSNNWLVDIYGGIAMRARHQIIVNEDHTISGDPDVPDSYAYSVDENNDIVPALFLGVRIGLGF